MAVLNHSLIKLGKLPCVHDDRNLKLANYLRHPEVPPFWGEEQYATGPFVNAYCDEAYAIISQDLLDGNGEAPNGFDLDSLTRDLQAVTR